METAPVPVSAESIQVAAHLDPGPSAYLEHAPLALFSLGSVVVGGVFYAISHGMDRPNISYTAGDRSSLTTAVSVAGVSALLAAGSYIYYVHRSREQSLPPSGWDAQAAALPDGQGGVAVSARLTLPLPGGR